jgi:lysyl-tRNA synthetase class 2
VSGAADWRPTARLEVLAARAGVLGAIRGFFQQAGVLEVETPALSFAAGTDPALASLSTTYTGPAAPQGAALHLHTSPEFAMKRLLAAGSGPIWQLCRVFRDGERGRQHNPEFTLLEWYRPGFGLHDLMDEVAALLRGVLGDGLAEERLSYAQAFDRALGIDPHRADVDTLRAAARDAGVAGADALDLSGRDAWLDLLMSHCVEPHLGAAGMTFVHDFPASQAALAQVRDGDPPVAERFEVYVRGIELANGFHELADADQQRRRFAADNARRRATGLPEMPVDERLLAALAAGLPDCCGVALGVDRLVMLATGATRIDEVIAFPLERA